MGLFSKKSRDGVTLLDKKFNKMLKNQIGIDESIEGQEFDNAIIDYVESGNKINLYMLSSEQKKNKDFMLRLFSADPTLIKEDTLDSDFKKDKDYMLKYYTLRNSCAKDCARYGMYWEEELLNDPEFVDKLSQSNPDIDILSLVTRVVDNSIFADGEKSKNIINQLNPETLVGQVKAFGLDALRKIPSDHSEYVTFVDAAVETIGYEGLRYLSVDKVLENKDIIYKAYEKDGVDALVKYITNDLNPNRKDGYMCHGEYHDYSYYSKQHEEDRDELLEDEKINGILEFNGLKVVKSYRVYQDLAITEMGE